LRPRDEEVDLAAGFLAPAALAAAGFLGAVVPVAACKVSDITKEI